MMALARLQRQFAEHGDAIALYHGDQSYSYAALAAAALATAEGLQASGLQPGRRVMLKMAGRLEWLVGFLACAAAGLNVVSVNNQLGADDVVYIEGLTRPDRALDAAQMALPGTGTVAELALHDIQVLFFTSGTTGRPKGVSHRFESLLANAAAFNELVGLDADVRMYHVMPMGYMAGLLNTFLSPLMAGGAVVLGEQFDARSALTFWAQPIRHQVNAVWLSPTMAAGLARLCRDDAVPSWTRQHLRFVLVGTAPLLESIRETFEGRFGVSCLESYGMTECMFAASQTPEQVRAGGRGVGRLLAGVEVRFIGGEGAPVAPVEGGDLQLRSIYTSEGYLDPDGSGLLPVAQDGWLNTGDVARADAAGNLQITGRRKDLIIHGGVNVSPVQVEEALLRHPQVHDAAVIGVAHDYWGEEVVAFVIADGAGGPEPVALKQYCGGLLPPDAVPARYHVVEAFPRASTGKVQKHLLREPA